MNDSYSRDISAKVRSQLEIKRKRGDFIGSFAVYGYEKDKKNRNRLVIDQQAAIVVKDIFTWKTEGKSNDGIAAKLNEMGIPSPMEYKKLNGMRYFSGFNQSGKASWSALSIKRILTDEVYLGHMVQGKKTTPNHKIKKVIEKNPDEWIKVENTHEPIISAQDYHTVQRILQMDTRISPLKKELYIFSGFACCADCKEAMVRKLVSSGGKKYPYLICSGYKKNKAGCTSHFINEKNLEEAVLLALNKHIDSIADMEEILRVINKVPAMNEGTKRLDLHILKATEEIKKLQKIKMSLYEDLADNIISKEEYDDLKKFYGSRILSLEKGVLRMKEEQDFITNKNIEKNVWITYFVAHHNIKKLTRSIILKFIDRIDIHEKGKITITFHFEYNYKKVNGGSFHGQNQQEEERNTTHNEG